jgi:glycosyltransferase involved in cell wall biosynthesis
MPDRPALTVCIPTVGRPGLRRTLRSLVLQDAYDPAAVEILVVGDSHGGATPELAEADRLCSRFDARFVAHDGGTHAWGQPQRNAAMALARGGWLWFLADDDMATPDSLAAIRAALAEEREPCPLLFRVHHWLGRPIWTVPALAEGNIDADCVVAPNVTGRLGAWTNRYEGDYDFIAETAERWDGRVAWRSEFVAICLPTYTADWTAIVPERVPA